MGLELLGLNRYESLAYKTLILLGEATAAQVSKEANVPYGRIYDVLAALEAKGFVNILPTNPKRFTPTDPQRLQEEFTKKQEEFNNLQKDLEELSTQYKTQDKPVLEVARGHNNFFRILKDMPKAKTFEYAIKYTSRYHPSWVRSTKQALKQGINKKSLVRYDEETQENVEQWLKHYQEQKVFDNQGVALSILDDAVMIALIKNNTTLLIQDEAFTDVMKRLFEAAYKQSSRVSE